ncbi:bacillithiol biosynthesis cysteine-adding enzyme BshC [Psychroflexus aestuariivivens]|uniref:bacillithiol biosynthesis cysteine-adding enzyme BshC n=1 Tax=Psychroflexus aestuariivivens TaxID=1795040 RepID=UPI000FDBA113|nr:bacillithiol biosynthesis cysteine-adding enzyme BshC [Psychroflexus aestuariivivens]
MADCLPYRATDYFSDIVYDYIEKNKDLEEFYGHFPDLENFKSQIDSKQKQFSKSQRETLVQVLKKQYQNVETSSLTSTHIEDIDDDKTFTITTGHQLNLFTGPLYFLYKIVSTINLAKTLKSEYPDYNFVPVYWMASEDHDFDEINFFHFKRKTYRWKNDADEGAVGKFSTENISELFQKIESDFGNSDHAEYLKGLFTKTYREHDTLAEATRFLANELFGKHGLVILDADEKSLKQNFISHIKNDLVYHTAFSQIQKQSDKLSDLGYKVQVNPREINLFYMKDNLRARIVKQDENYYVLDTELKYSETEILDLVDKYPERFSPNVSLRPLYQEVVLPNLCYIGGGGELAYWLELKSYFDAENVLFPILLLRNSALLYSDKTAKKLKNLDLNIKDLFLTPPKLEAKHTKKISKIDIDFEDQKDFLKKQFESLFEIAKQTDESFYGAVAAQEQKQINGLENLEKRLLKAQKKKLHDENSRVLKLQEMLFPNGLLQERYLNFSEIYVDFGDELISTLLENLKPLELEFTCLELNVYHSK